MNQSSSVTNLTAGIMETTIEKVAWHVADAKRNLGATFKARHQDDPWSEEGMP